MPRFSAGCGDDLIWSSKLANCLSVCSVLMPAPNRSILLGRKFSGGRPGPEFFQARTSLEG